MKIHSFAHFQTVLQNPKMKSCWPPNQGEHSDRLICPQQSDTAPSSLTQALTYSFSVWWEISKDDISRQLQLSPPNWAA